MIPVELSEKDIEVSSNQIDKGSLGEIYDCLMKTLPGVKLIAKKFKRL